MAAVEWLTLRAAWQYDEGHLTGPPPQVDHSRAIRQALNIAK